MNEPLAAILSRLGAAQYHEYLARNVSRRRVVGGGYAEEVANAQELCFETE